MTNVLILDAAAIKELITLEELIECLSQAFGKEYVVPERHAVSVPGGAGRLLVTMPAFNKDGSGIVKLFTAFPDNRHKNAPYIQASVLVFSDRGELEAILDGTTITRMRTGAASALASRFLSRPDSSELVVIGDGALVPTLVAAHCKVRPIRRVKISGRRHDKVEATIKQINDFGLSIKVERATALSDAVAEADIVSCATSSATPVLEGRWLREGTYVDLIGSFSPHERESDDQVMINSRIFVDTRTGALAEAGDILDPLRRGIIAQSQIEGELADLVSGKVRGRRTDEEIIVFKSVGTALEDIATSQLILEKQRELRRLTTHQIFSSQHFATSAD